MRLSDSAAIEIVALGETLHGHPGAPRSVSRLGTLGARLRSPLHIGLASLYNAVASMQAGDPHHAADACRTALDAWHGQPYDVQILEALDVLAWASAAGGQAETAGRLLTTTAEHYFPSFGFTETTRDVVPDDIRATGEFRGTCPESAIAMRLSL